MVKKIKSSYFIKILFFHINERVKLKIAKYNQILQNTIDINLNNYKAFTEKYIISDTNGIIKEYYDFNVFDQRLVYEGEYLNGERNGKGKEYNDYGKLIYEGEFLNGKRNGKGKEYDEYGQVKFEGDYLNGNR